jgi:hypothetical protein
MCGVTRPVGRWRRRGHRRRGCSRRRGRSVRGLSFGNRRRARDKQPCQRQRRRTKFHEGSPCGARSGRTSRHRCPLPCFDVIVAPETPCWPAPACDRRPAPGPNGNIIHAASVCRGSCCPHSLE